MFEVVEGRIHAGTPTKILRGGDTIGPGRCGCWWAPNVIWGRLMQPHHQFYYSPGREAPTAPFGFSYLQPKSTHKQQC